MKFQILNQYNIRKFQVSSDVKDVEILRLDHKYPGTDEGVVVVLYGEIGTPEFSNFHVILKEYAERNEIQYVVRHWVKVGHLLIHF
jgi:UDP-glucose:glycoprotein glucosyltransferase